MKQKNWQKVFKKGRVYYFCYVSITRSDHKFPFHADLGTIGGDKQTQNNKKTSIVTYRLID